MTSPFTTLVEGGLGTGFPTNGGEGLPTNGGEGLPATLGLPPATLLAARGGEGLPATPGGFVGAGLTGLGDVLAFPSVAGVLGLFSVPGKLPSCCA